MSDGRFNWVKTFSIGCGLLVALPIVAVLVVTLRTWVPLQSSGSSLAKLDEQFGAQIEFVPAPDGAVDPSRIVTFLEVRQSLHEICEEINAIERELGRVDNLEEEHSEPSPREVAGVTRMLAGLAAEITPIVGRFFKERNRALLDAEIGLGEYSYIFALAYREQFQDESIHRPLFSDDGPLSAKAAEALRAMLTHQRDSLADETDAESRRRELSAEIQAMQQDSQRLPWQDRLPAEIDASLTPYRKQLDEAFCLNSAGIEMDPDSRRALYIALE